MNWVIQIAHSFQKNDLKNYISENERMNGTILNKTLQELIKERNE
jgi:hypothetical protein